MRLDGGTDYEKEFRGADTYARRHQDSVFVAWQIAGQYPDLAAKLAQDDSAFSTALLAAVAMNRQRLDALLRDVTDADKRRRAEAEARLLQETMEEILRAFGAAPYAILFANGDIRGVATDEEEKPVPGTGSIGISISQGKRTWQASMAVASTLDTITSGHGSAVLSPGTGRGLRSGVLALRGPVRYLGVGPWQAYGSLSRYTWRASVPVEGGGTTTETADASVIGLGLLKVWRLGCCRVFDNNVSLTVMSGPAYRNVGGNLEGHRALRVAALGTSKRNYAGLESGLEIVMGRVTGMLQLYNLLAIDKASAKVDGLTHSQIVAAFSVSGEAFRGPLVP
jgi:hypothetical protein